ncbi:MAG: CmcI family methyltransferase, partial [bacterium]
MKSKLSVIIPSLNEEQYLDKTVRNVLANAEGEIEVIAILDGWQPTQWVTDDKRVIYIRHNEPIGQRPSINEAMRIASGSHMMKLDAHCAVGKGFDKILIRDCEYDMTMVPAMFNLDVETWQPRDIDNLDIATRRGKYNPYMFIGWKDGRLRACYYPGNLRKQLYTERKDIPIDETMCCMGPGWFMHTKRFWELDGCDENHGHWGQQGVEVACKAWLSGGRLMTNKNTWFAHFFRGGGVPEGHQKGFPFKLSQAAVDRARDYSEDLWLNNKWDKQTRTMEWLVEKFNPPTWNGHNPKAKVEAPDKRMDLFIPMYKHIHHRKRDAIWKGVTLWKFPTDMQLYHEAIFDKKPDVIVEIGTAHGGSSLYLQDMLDMINPGARVITIDIRDRLKMSRDPRITYIIGDSTKESTYNKVKALINENDKVMVTIDGNHDRVPVKWDLHWYSRLVTKEQYLVVEDCYTDKGKWGPCEAKEWF